MGSTLKHLVELAGPEAAEALCRAYGGVTHYIPLKPRHDHQFVAIIGMPAFLKLCHHYGGSSLVLPQGGHYFKRRMVLDLLQNTNLSIRQIAIKAGCTERYATRLSSEIKNDQQQKLPFGIEAGV